jgi:hypothetical protein
MNDFILVPGKFNTTNKLFQSKLYSPTTIVSQSIYSIGKNLMTSFYENDYVKENSYDFEKGQGKLFVTESGQTYPMEIDEEISFASKNKGYPKIFKLNRATLEFQIELLQSKKYDLDLLNHEQRQQHFQNLKTTIEYTKRQIQYYDY